MAGERECKQKKKKRRGLQQKFNRRDLQHRERQGEKRTSEEEAKKRKRTMCLNQIKMKYQEENLNQRSKKMQ